MRKFESHHKKITILILCFTTKIIFLHILMVFIQLTKKYLIMKHLKFHAFALGALMLLSSSCSTMSNTAKGGAIGAGGGAALGAIIGAIAGQGKGAAIGAAIGTAVGGTAGVLIGQKMDKAEKDRPLGRLEQPLCQEQG